MTHEQTVRAKIKALEDMLPVAIAADQGKEVEYLDNGIWCPTDNPTWMQTRQYRIKPEPPLERYIVKYATGHEEICTTEQFANRRANMATGSRVVLMREVRE